MEERGQDVRYIRKRANDEGSTKVEVSLARIVRSLLLGASTAGGKGWRGGRGWRKVHAYITSLDEVSPRAARVLLPRVS